MKPSSILSSEEDRRADDWVSQLGGEAARRAGGQGVRNNARQAIGKIGLECIGRLGRCKTVGLYILCFYEFIYLYLSLHFIPFFYILNILK